MSNEKGQRNALPNETARLIAAVEENLGLHYAVDELEKRGSSPQSAIRQLLPEKIPPIGSKKP